MGRITLQGNPPIEVDVRQSARARRLSLRVSSLDGRVTLTLPRGVAEAEGRRFAAEKAGWIARAQASRAPEVTVGIGAAIPVEGREITVRAGPGRSARLEGATLFAPERSAARVVRAWLVEEARGRAREAVDRHAAALGRPAGRLTLRDTRSRWGSCSAAGDIMLSWRLILAPPGILDYVAAHEVAHLAEMNHGPRFWAQVRRLSPDFETRRRWLRTHGNALHRYRFD